MRSFHVLYTTALVLALSLVGCTPDIPEGIDPVSEPLLPWKYPDTVKVTASFIHTGLLSERSALPEPELDAVHRKWLEKHDYVQVKSRFDSTATHELNNALNEEGDRGITVGAVFTQTFVRVE